MNVFPLAWSFLEFGPVLAKVKSKLLAEDIFDSIRTSLKAQGLGEYILALTLSGCLSYQSTGSFKGDFLESNS